MKNKKYNAGFAPLLIIAIVAVLAIGGGVYISKNKSADDKKVDVQSGDNVTADTKANAGFELGVNSKGSFRSLLGAGKDIMCTFTSTLSGMTSSGTVYVAGSGEMRGDFSTKTTAGTQSSSMIVKDETSYVWTGTQGMKMDVSGGDDSKTKTDVKTDSNVDLDSQVDYNCSNWTKDSSKFVPPTSVKFMDIGALMKDSTNVDLKNLPY